MTQRVVQTEDPAAIPAPERRPGTAAGRPGEDLAGQLAVVAGAVAALAGRVDRLGERVTAGQRPKVTLGERSRALEQARELITELGLPPRYERVHAELAVARYLTGE